MKDSIYIWYILSRIKYFSVDGNSFFGLFTEGEICYYCLKKQIATRHFRCVKYLNITCDNLLGRMEQYGIPDRALFGLKFSLYQGNPGNRPNYLASCNFNPKYPFLQLETPIESVIYQRQKFLLLNPPYMHHRLGGIRKEFKDI